MTIILGAKTAEGTFLGADARAANSYGNYADNVPKLMRIHNYVIGVSGSTRVRQLILFNQDSFKAIEQDADVFAFGTALRDILAEDHKADVGYERKETFTMLIAAPAGIYCMHKNFQFNQHESWACGSGEDFGLGYFRALPLEDTELRIKTAIEETARYINSVGGPASVMKV